MQKSLIKSDYQSLIFEFRAYKVMIDADLAALYETETKVLNSRLKEILIDFLTILCFNLPVKKRNNWSQIVTAYLI